MKLSKIYDKGKCTHLHAMNSQAWASVQFLVANMAFKMLCLLMLNQDLFIIKVSITVPCVRSKGEKHQQYTMLQQSSSRQRIT